MPTENQYPLWSFAVGRDIIITRGRTQDEAFQWAVRDGSIDAPAAKLNFSLINAARLYTKNHPFDWLFTAPRWIQNKKR